MPRRIDTILLKCSPQFKRCLFLIDEDEIHRMANSADVKERRNAAKHLDIFEFMYNKEGAWEDLHRLAQDEDSGVRWRAADVLGPVFSHIPDKDTALADLHRLTQDGNEEVRGSAAYALGSAFSDIPDKDNAWSDLHRLTQDEEELVRGWAAGAFCFAFSNIPDKDDAWSDLHRLTQDEGSYVRGWAASALGSAFSDIPDTDIAWSDLHRLTQDEDYEVRGSAASALGSAFSDIPDTDAAWSDLHRLIETEGSYVRIFAYHSLGSASVYKATETEDEDKFRDELKKAIDYFESSSRESVCESYNPARFCLPFYRSYYAVISRQQEADATKYLDEAKNAADGSEGSEILLKAVENLANALKEAQKPLDFGETQEHLKACRQYCDHTAELMDSTRGKSPVAAAAIMRGIPIVEVKVKEIIAEIQEKAKTLYKKTKGTSLEEIGLETVKSAQKLTTGDILKFYRILENIGGKLNIFCEYLPDDAKKSICGKIRDSRNLDIIEQAETIDQGFDYMLLHFPIPPIITVSANKKNKQKQDIVRIAAIQLAFKLTNSFPPTLEKKDDCKPKIISALDTAKSSGAHIACLPELCMCEEWVQEFKDRYPDMIIIGGSYYKNDFNECPIIMNMEVPPQLKKSPSRFEDPEITGRGMKSGDKLYRYETQFGTFSVLVCIDFLNYAKFCDQTDIIFCPSYNEAKGIERFHEYANSHVTNTPSYIIISNTALFGGTSIFGQLHRDYYRGLVENGCKRRDDDSYKLCNLEEGFEGIIIANFDLVHKSSQVPTPADSNKVIKSIKNIECIKIS